MRDWLRIAVWACVALLVLWSFLAAGKLAKIRERIEDQRAYPMVEL